MKRSNRSHVEIAGSILMVCKVPQLKTHVMYRVGLSFRQLQSLLKELIGMNLLREEQYEEEGILVTKYVTTVYGLEWIEHYEFIVKPFVMSQPLPLSTFRE